MGSLRRGAEAGPAGGRAADDDGRSRMTRNGPTREPVVRTMEVGQKRVSFRLAGTRVCYGSLLGGDQVTIAVLVKVNEGLVFASDSAMTIPQAQPGGKLDLANIYINANKIFNLHKGLPIATMTAGLGSIGTKSISALAKDLRVCFSGQGPSHPEWKLDPATYTVEDVVQRTKTFFYDERYLPFVTPRVPRLAALPKEQQDLVRGLLRLDLVVGGYGSTSEDPKAYSMTFNLDGCEGPNELNPNTTGISWWGQSESVFRLVRGIGAALPQAVQQPGVQPAQSLVFTEAIANQVQVKDAIDLAEFLVQVTRDSANAVADCRIITGTAHVSGPVRSGYAAVSTTPFRASTPSTL